MFTNIHFNTVISSAEMVSVFFSPLTRVWSHHCSFIFHAGVQWDSEMSFKCSVPTQDLCTL